MTSLVALFVQFLIQNFNFVTTGCGAPSHWTAVLTQMVRCYLSNRWIWASPSTIFVGHPTTVHFSLLVWVMAAWSFGIWLKIYLTPSSHSILATTTLVAHASGTFLLQFPRSRLRVCFRSCFQNYNFESNFNHSFKNQFWICKNININFQFCRFALNSPVLVCGDAEGKVNVMRMYVLKDSCNIIL